MMGHAVVSVDDEKFYEQYTPGGLRSARIILPLVLAHLSVRSAVDIGCGCGA